MKHVIATFIFLLLTNTALPQAYMEGKTRHRFAQLTLGADYHLLSGAGTRFASINENGLKQNTVLNNQHEGRLIIGGTHFWGHADFYIAFPVMAWGKSGYSGGVETGFKYFPWRIEKGKIRPYAGIALNATSFQQINGVKLERTVYPVLAGLSYLHHNKLLEIGLAYNPKNQFEYYLSREASAELKTHPIWLTVGLKFMLETTVSAEKSWQDGTSQKTTESLAAANKLNSFSIAIGPSSAWFTRNSEFNKANRPYLDNHKIAGIFPEYGIGYYHHKWDAHLNLAYRNIKDASAAYGLEQQVNRKALTLEAYKSLFDYHGFAPFIGPALSREWLAVTEKENGTEITKEQFTGLKPGITFGWDIRPNRLQKIVLRTNLRYFPNLNVKMTDGKAFALDQLEFNFIQVVIYPQRFKL